MNEPCVEGNQLWMYGIFLLELDDLRLTLFRGITILRHV